MLGRLEGPCKGVFWTPYPIPSLSDPWHDRSNCRSISISRTTAPPAATCTPCHFSKVSRLSFVLVALRACLGARIWRATTLPHLLSPSLPAWRMARNGQSSSAQPEGVRYYVALYIYRYMYTCVCMYVCICVYIYIYIHVCIYTYVCACIYIYIYIYMCIYIYIYTYMYMYIYIYTCIYT